MAVWKAHYFVTKDNGGRGKTDYCGCPARLLQGNRKEDRAVVPTERDWPDGYSRKGFAGG